MTATMKKIFTLIIVAALTATGHINAQQTVTGLVGDTLSLNLGSPRGTIQWEKSTDNSTYTAMSGETANTLSYVVDVLPLYFRAIITEGECDPITSPYVEVSSSINPPTVTTAAISNITQTTADGGGNVTSDGGSPIIARGLCWSTSPNPTINDNTSNASGTTGAFTSQLTGLTPGTLYYVRAWAVNTALQTTPGYGSQVQFISQSSYQIGGNGPGGGVVFHLDGQGGGLEVATTDVGGFENWGCSGTTTSATGTAVGTGSSNTASIISGCNDPNYAAKLCDGLTSGGQSDWVLPSVDELDSIYTNLVNITTPAITINTVNDYWSSSETGPTTALTYFFGTGGGSTNANKITGFRVRCVRSF